MSGPGAPRVLVVDDEPQIHRFLGPALQAAGYEPLRAGTATDGLRLAAQRSPALVLLDLGLPDMDGKLAIPRLRAFTRRPILVLSARDLEAEKVAALDAGADDYVEKPFALASCWRACGRRCAGRPPREGRTPRRRSADRAGGGGPRLPRRARGRRGALKLTPARVGSAGGPRAGRSGRVVTQRQLLTAVWGPAHTEDAQYLRVYVGHLRQKLGVAARLLRTEPGVGYRFGEAE